MSGDLNQFFKLYFDLLLLAFCTCQSKLTGFGSNRLKLLVEIIFTETVQFQFPCKIGFRKISVSVKNLFPCNGTVQDIRQQKQCRISDFYGPVTYLVKEKA